MCLEWKIPYEKISAVVTDGGANIKGAVRGEFGVLQHISCMSHLINGIGQACVGLKNFKVPSEIENPRELPEDGDSEDDIEAHEAQFGEDLLKKIIIKVKRIVRFFQRSKIATAELGRLQKESGKSIGGIHVTKCLTDFYNCRILWIWLFLKYVEIRALRQNRQICSSRAKLKFLTRLRLCLCLCGR